MSSGIYAIINTVNHKCYVGSAVHLTNRWAEHQRDLQRGVHHSYKLQAAVTKYGLDALTFCVLEECVPADLITREQYWMDALSSVRQGYNVAPEARSCAAWWADPATRTRRIAAIQAVRGQISESFRRLWQTPEYRARMLAQRADPEYKARHQQALQAVGNRIGAAHRALWADPEHRAQRVQRIRDVAATPEYRARLRAGHNAPEHRALLATQARQRWQDPAYRERVLQARKEAAARRKAAQLQP